MSNVKEITEHVEMDLARECLYRFLAAALSDPLGRAWHALLETESQQLALEAAALVREHAAMTRVNLGIGELPPELLTFEPLCEALKEGDSWIRAEYDRIFGLTVCRECPPYETEYLASSETFFRSQQMADIAGFYRAFGIEPAHGHPERPDHVALELEFMALLLTKKRLVSMEPDENSDLNQRRDICADAAKSFFTEHIAWWLPAFAQGLRKKAGVGFYAAVAHALAAFVSIERGHFEVPAPRMPLQPTFIERPEEQPGCACDEAVVEAT